MHYENDLEHELGCFSFAKTRRNLRLTSSGKHRAVRGNAPAQIQVAGNNVLREEGLAYAGKIDAAGLDFAPVRYDEMIQDHYF
jgi:acetyl esterase/lipase